jgi:bacillolysin
MKKNKIYLMLYFIVIAINLKAQQNNGIASFFQNNIYTFDSLQKIELSNFFNNYQVDLGITSNDSFAIQYTNYTPDKKFDIRYLQYHKGYLVDGASFILHGERNVVLYAAGNQVKNLNTNVSSPISESAALSAALTYLSGYTFDYQVDSFWHGHRDMMDDSTYIEMPEGSLVICKIRDSSWEASNFKLTWKFHLNIIDPVDSNITVYVDALTGNIVNCFDRVNHGTYGTGTVQTIYNGTQNIRTFKCTFCSHWRLKSDKNIISYDNTNGIDKSVELRDRDNNWSDYDEQNTTTVHWATERAYSYFNDRHHRNGSDNKGITLKNYCNLPYGILAKYIEEKDHDVIAIGERRGGVSPATLDIVGHEYAHSFIKRNPNLNMLNENHESGALNEGFADIFGELIEKHVLGSSNFMIGLDAIGITSVRNFADPHLTISPDGGQPARYQEPGYWDFTNSNYHKNAGVLTHWFYLLSHGGTYNGVTVPNVDIETADDIAFVTMMWWLWHNATFEDAKNASISAAIAHWGRCSKEHKAAVYAWAAVGLGTISTSGCPWIRIKGGHVININELASNPVKFIISPTNDNESTPNPEKIQWEIPENWVATLNIEKTELTVHSVINMESKELRVAVTNDANESDTIRHIVHIVNYTDTVNYNINTQESNMRKAIANDNDIVSASDILVYPNPANEFVNIFIGGEDGKMELYNIMGAKVKRAQLGSRMNTIDISDLSTGSYILKITTNQQQQTIHLNIHR